MGAVQPGAGGLAQGVAVQLLQAARLPVRFKHDGGNDGASPLLIGQADDAGLGHAVDTGEGLLHVAGLDLDAPGDDDVVQAAQDLQAPVGVQPAAVGGGQDARAAVAVEALAGVGVAVGPACGAVAGGVEVVLGQDGTGDEDAASALGVGGLDGDLDPLQGVAVVDAAPAGLAHAVGGDHGDARPAGPVQERGVGGGAAQEDGVGSCQGPAGLRVLQDAHQLGGDQGDVEPGGGRPGGPARRAQGLRERRRAESCARVDHDGLGSGLQGADEDLQAGDVVGRQGQEPGSRATKARVGSAGRGHEGGGAHGDESAGTGGGARRAQDEVGACRDAGDTAGQVGPDLPLVLPGGNGDKQRQRRDRPVLPVLGGGGRESIAGGEQAAQGQTLGEGSAQGGDVVGGGPASQEAEGGRGGHPMIVPRPGPAGDPAGDEAGAP